MSENSLPEPKPIALMGQGGAAEPPQSHCGTNDGLWQRL